MIINPILPLWLITTISIILFIFIFKYTNKKLRIYKIIIIILLFLINLRVMYKTNNSTTLSNDLDIIFVVDSTISMNAEDYPNSTRLIEAKKDINHIIDYFNGARFSIINFNNNSKILVPFTSDSNMIKNSIEAISPLYEYYAHGSSLNTPKKDIIKLLENSNKEDNKIKILFFISDGEITDDSKLESYKKVSDLVYNGAILGYGTTKGGYMQTTDYFGESKYVIDRSDYKYNKAISKFNENNLKQIAKDTNLDYIYMNSQNNIDTKLKDIKSLTKNKTDKNDKYSYGDTYYFLIIPIFIILILNYKKYKEVIPI